MQKFLFWRFFHNKVAVEDKKKEIYSALVIFSPYI